ncbi:MAG: hypothetical protein Q4E34_04655 [Synergistaceae bacterium]|nr:hypothetical protein [Synergistaceae bacterium]
MTNTLATTQLQEETHDIVAQAQSIVVMDNDSYNKAEQFARSLKELEKKIKAFWAEPKQKAYDAHKAITNQEKAMLEPVTTAIKAISNKTVAYMLAVKKQQEEAEAAARREAEAAAKAKLEEAKQLEEAGDTETAEELRVEAEAFEAAASTLKVEAEAPKAEGVSYRKDWEISVTDEMAVPTSVMGAVIRPVDLAKVKALVKATQGKIEIPGIVVKETLTPVRRG